MTLNEYIKQSYIEMLDSNNLTEEQFKDMFKDKNPILKFTVHLDYVKVYIGEKDADDENLVVEMARLKPKDVLSNKAYENYETTQIVLCAVYALDVLIGYDNNPIRNVSYTKYLDSDLNELIKEEIRKDEKLCRRLRDELYFKRYHGIQLDVENPAVPTEMLEKFDWLGDWFYIIKEPKFIVVCAPDAFEDLFENADNFPLGDIVANLEQGRLEDLYMIVDETKNSTVLIMDKYKEV